MVTPPHNAKRNTQFAKNVLIQKGDKDRPDTDNMKRSPDGTEQWKIPMGNYRLLN